MLVIAWARHEKNAVNRRGPQVVLARKARKQCSTVLRTVIRAIVRRKMHASQQVSLSKTARRGVDADTQGGNSSENCSTLVGHHGPRCLATILDCATPPI